MEIFNELYQIFGVAALLIIGVYYVWKDKQKSIDNLHLRIKELEALNLDLINKNMEAINWFQNHVDRNG